MTFICSLLFGSDSKKRRPTCPLVVQVTPKKMPSRKKWKIIWQWIQSMTLIWNHWNGGILKGRFHFQIFFWSLKNGLFVRVQVLQGKKFCLKLKFRSKILYIWFFSERIFNIAGDLIRKKRERLGVESANMIIRCNANLK